MGTESKQQKSKTSKDNNKQVENTFTDTSHAPSPGTLLYLQRTVGNRAVQNLLNKNRLQYPAKQNTGAAQIALKRNQSVVQREDKAGSDAKSLTFQGYTLSTYGDLANFFQTHVENLKSQEDELTKDKVFAPMQLKHAIKVGTDLQKQYAAESDKPMNMLSGIAVQGWWDENYVKGMNAAEAFKALEAASRMGKVKAELEGGANKVTSQVLPELRKAQAVMFRKEDEQKLLKLADAVATALDTATGFKDVANAIADDITSLRNLANTAKGSTSVASSVNTKVAIITELADKVNKAYATFQLMRTAISLASGSTTELQSATKGIEAMSTLISAGGTLLGASAGFSLYANFYIGPMVEACLGQIAKIEGISREINAGLIAEGLFDKVIWSVMPGGRAVFDFMLTVMRAGDSSGVPKPVPQAVSDYFVGKEDKLEAGTGNTDMPTTGWLWWEKVDENKIARWVYNNRHNIWGMLYGDIPVPN